MRIKRPKSKKGLGTGASIPCRASSVGRTVRFLYDVPLNARCVYTRRMLFHHWLHQAQTATIVSVSYAGDDTACLAVPFRSRLVRHVPLSFMEFVPTPPKSLGPITGDFAYEGCPVRFALDCNVTQKGAYSLLDYSDRVIKLGQCATIWRFGPIACDVTLPGRKRPLTGVPYDYLEQLEKPAGNPETPL